MAEKIVRLRMSDGGNVNMHQPVDRNEEVVRANEISRARRLLWWIRATVWQIGVFLTILYLFAGAIALFVHSGWGDGLSESQLDLVAVIRTLLTYAIPILVVVIKLSKLVWILVYQSISGRITRLNNTSKSQNNVNGVKLDQAFALIPIQKLIAPRPLRPHVVEFKPLQLSSDQQQPILPNNRSNPRELQLLYRDKCQMNTSCIVKVLGGKGGTGAVIHDRSIALRQNTHLVASRAPMQTNLNAFLDHNFDVSSVNVLLAPNFVSLPSKNCCIISHIPFDATTQLSMFNSANGISRKAVDILDEILSQGAEQSVVVSISCSAHQIFHSGILLDVFSPCRQCFPGTKQCHHLSPACHGSGQARSITSALDLKNVMYEVGLRFQQNSALYQIRQQSNTDRPLLPPDVVSAFLLSISWRHEQDIDRPQSWRRTTMALIDLQTEEPEKVCGDNRSKQLLGSILHPLLRQDASFTLVSGVCDQFDASQKLKHAACLRQLFEIMAGRNTVFQDNWHLTEAECAVSDVSMDSAGRVRSLNTPYAQNKPSLAVEQWNVCTEEVDDDDTSLNTDNDSSLGKSGSMSEIMSDSSPISSMSADDGDLAMAQANKDGFDYEAFGPMCASPSTLSYKVLDGHLDTPTAHDGTRHNTETKNQDTDSNLMIGKRQNDNGDSIQTSAHSDREKDVNLEDLLSRRLQQGAAADEVPQSPNVMDVSQEISQDPNAVRPYQWTEEDLLEMF